MEDNVIKEHLAAYKSKDLNITENGTWKKNNKQYAHILPERLKDKNIINSDYHRMIINAIANGNIKLHSDFHHLNSSQALCFNLFYPLFLENEMLSFLNKLNQKLQQNDTIEKYKFEYIENINENTNFDLYIRTNKTKYYFEIKYTENEFGKAKNDEKHIQKYNNIYKEKLLNFNNVTMEIFFYYYQIFRNLIYNDGYNIFVFPSNRIDLESTINEVMEKHCTKNQRNRIIILPIEKIVEMILDSNNNKLVKHYNIFMEKYCLK
jgi:hypothetical protein